MAPVFRLQQWPIQNLPGLTPEDLQKLQALEIHSTGDLLPYGRSPSQLRQLAHELHIPERFVRKWLALATLAQLPSVNCQYCGLLLHAGITDLSQLAKTNTHRLHRHILRLQVATLTRRDLCPHPGIVGQWIQEAQRCQPNSPRTR
jgi:hypothetical protein